MAEHAGTVMRPRELLCTQAMLRSVTGCSMVGCKRSAERVRTSMRDAGVAIPIANYLWRGTRRATRRNAARLSLCRAGQSSVVTVRVLSREHRIAGAVEYSGCRPTMPRVGYA